MVRVLSHQQDQIPIFNNNQRLFEVWYSKKKKSNGSIVDLDEIVEVFERSVQMRLSANRDNLCEVQVVDMRIDSKKSLHDCFCMFSEIFGKRLINTCREDFLIVHDRLDPFRSIERRFLPLFVVQLLICIFFFFFVLQVIK